MDIVSISLDTDRFRFHGHHIDPDRGPRRIRDDRLVDRIRVRHGVANGLTQRALRLMGGHIRI